MSRHVDEELHEEGKCEDVLEHAEGSVCFVVGAAVAGQLGLQNVHNEAEEDKDRNGALHDDVPIEPSQAETELLNHAGTRHLLDHGLVRFLAQQLKPFSAQFLGPGVKVICAPAVVACFDCSDLNHV